MRRIFISIPWFSPAYKAGGPIQSMVNMLAALKGEANFYVFTSATDLDGLPITVSHTNCWLPYNESTKVWYADKQGSSKELLKQVKSIGPDILYIVGIFHLQYNIVPMLWAKAPKKIISLRGMLLPSALAQKAWKKKFIMAFLKAKGIFTSCSFHATDEVEAREAQKILGSKAVIHIAANFPRLLSPPVPLPHKQVGELNMVSVGIISPMKNYLLVLQALKEVDAKIHYTIYGPVKEPAYWAECMGCIKALPAHISVSFQHELPPAALTNALHGAHLFILPSKSENYGHAIVEALSAGLPVITSKAVPWLGMQQAGAGINLQPTVQNIADAINRFAGMDAASWQQASQQALAYIQSRIDWDAIIKQYAFLTAEE